MAVEKPAWTARVDQPDGNAGSGHESEKGRGDVEAEEDGGDETAQEGDPPEEGDDFVGGRSRLWDPWPR